MKIKICNQKIKSKKTKIQKLFAVQCSACNAVQYSAVSGRTVRILSALGRVCSVATPKLNGK